jgi:hypothetical protein
MALHSIEYSRPIPLEQFFDPNAPVIDHGKYFRRGWIIAKTLGVGVHEDILPASCKRFAPDLRMPVLVNPDGTALVAIRKELGIIAPKGRVFEASGGNNRLVITELISEEDRDLYTFFGIPAATPTLPYFAIEPGLRGTWLNRCYGMLIHKPGRSPQDNIPLPTIGDLSRALR